MIRRLVQWFVVNGAAFALLVAGTHGYPVALVPYKMILWFTMVASGIGVFLIPNQLWQLTITKLAADKRPNMVFAYLEFLWLVVTLSAIIVWTNDGGLTALATLDGLFSILLLKRLTTLAEEMDT